MSITGDLTVTVDVAAIDEMIARVGKMQAVVEKYAALIADEARRLVPVKTGALKASITATLDGLTAEIAAGEGLPDIRAIVMEYGSSVVAARPYLRPAVERYAEAFIAEVAATLASG